MRRCSVLLLLVAALLMSSGAFAAAFSINFTPIMQYCHEQFYALAQVTFYDPTTADWTVSGGVGILDVEEFKLVALVLGNAAAPHHDAVHSAFVQNQLAAKTAIGTTIIGLTTAPGATYGADALMGAYLTMGEWALYDTTMVGFKTSPFGSKVIWGTEEGTSEAYKVNYDLTCEPFVSMCGDCDDDGVKNCNEYWGADPDGYAGAINPAVTTAAMNWNAWTCLDENNSSYRFIYNPTTQRVYMTSPMEVTWAEALAFTVQYPGGATVPTSMVTIRNATENTYVKNLGNGNTVWIGCTDAAKDGPTSVAPNKADWYWLSDPTQSVMTYENWNSPPNGTGGEPNGVNHAEDLGSMRDDGLWNDLGPNSGTPPTPRKYYAIFETTGTWPDADTNGAPDAFEDKNGDLIPDEFGVPLPSAAFSADVTSGDMPLEVTFTDASDGNGETITSWEWDFGDGDTSTDQNPVHTYMAADPSSSYTVSLTVTTVNGSDTEIKTNYITVDYVCAFDGKTAFEGLLLNEAIMGPDTISQDLKDLLTALGVVDWEDWNIEGLENFPPTMPGDGLPDAVQVALVEYVACNTALPTNAEVFTGMMTNYDLFAADVATLSGFDPNFAALALFKDLFAAMIGSSPEMKDTVNALILALTGGATGLPSYADYVVFGVAKAGPLFAGYGDLDGDGITNEDEYQQVLAAGGGLDTFLLAATDPENFWPGNPALPVAGIVGLGLLAGSMLLGAGFALRKK